MVYDPKLNQTFSTVHTTLTLPTVRWHPSGRSIAVGCSTAIAATACLTWRVAAVTVDHAMPNGHVLITNDCATLVANSGYGPVAVTVVGAARGETAQPIAIYKPTASTILLERPGTMPDGAQNGTSRLIAVVGETLESPVPVEASGEESPITRIVRENAAQLKFCYETRLKANSDLAGRVELKWHVEGGRVSTVEVVTNTTGDSDLADCVVGKVKRWYGFPASFEGDAQWPFIFAQESGPAAVSTSVVAGEGDVVSAPARSIAAVQLINDGEILEMVKARVRIQLPELRDACYVAGLERNGELQGVWLLEFTVVPDGTVADVAALSKDDTTAPDARFEDCLRGAVATWTFEPIRAPLPVAKSVGFSPVPRE